MKISIKEELRYGAAMARKHLWHTAGVLLAMFFLSALPDIATELFPRVTDATYQFTVLLLSWIGSLYFGLVFTHIVLRGVRGKTFDLAESLGVWIYLPIYGFTYILYSIIGIVGLVLLIVPGIIWASKFLLFPFVLLEQDVGGIASLKESARLTKGHMLEVVLLLLVVACLYTLGFVALVIGLFFTVPMSMYMIAHVYAKLREEKRVEGEG